MNISETLSDVLSKMKPPHLHHNHDHSDHSNHAEHSSNSNPSSPHKDHGSCGSGGGGHNMIMHPGFTESIVFPGWKTVNAGEFVGTCFALVFIAIAYEGLKLLRDQLAHTKLRMKKKRIKDTTTLNGPSQTDADSQSIGPANTASLSDKLKIYFDHLIQTSLHVLQFAISYFLMLAAMTYNYWIVLSILIGIAIGFFAFGVRRSIIDLNEDCH